MQKCAAFSPIWAADLAFNLFHNLINSASVGICIQQEFTKRCIFLFNGLSLAMILNPSHISFLYLRFFRKVFFKIAVVAHSVMKVLIMPSDYSSAFCAIKNFLFQLLHLINNFHKRIFFLVQCCNLLSCFSKEAAFFIQHFY